MVKRPSPTPSQRQGCADSGHLSTDSISAPFDPKLRFQTNLRPLPLAPAQPIFLVTITRNAFNSTIKR
jgi:hypothetical protein